jgi:tRNA A-37 threonylcarbamoyl transferase component Bud32
MAHQVAGGSPAPGTSPHRRRRPVGEPPPLPRDLHGPTTLWIATVLLLGAIYVWGKYGGPTAGQFQRWIDRGVSSFIPDLSAGRMATTGRALASNIGLWLLIAIRWGTAVALISWKRWRHLAVFVGSVVLVTVLARFFPTAGTLPSTPKHPAYAAASLAVTVMGIVYGLVPAGPPRRRALWVSAAVCGSLAAFSILTRTYSPSEIGIGFAIGFSVPFLGFRLLAPETVFPVTYGSGKTAHLDVEGSRGAAIDTALRDQLGLDVARKEPFGLAGSGGSTPLRIELTDGHRLFGKLYAENHLRADRWYKLGRTVMYGALEDERSFNSVRRMVEYEDHMLRYLRDHAVRTAEPYGFAEITPEREYLLVTSFIDDAEEVLTSPIDDTVIASGIDLVRSLWDAGVAHRDIKPANLLVRAEELYLIDVFFCQVRPSAWRQSVDLANMLMLLALGSDVERVYEAALRRFTPDDIAEAFAATKGVTVPGQLRAMVMADPRPLAKEFSNRAPDRSRIPVQRWTIRRVLLSSLLLGSAVIAVVTAILSLRAAGFRP